MTPDIINASFEAIAALLTCINILKLYQHKEVKGISLLPTLFFTAWGFWNVIYYPMLNQLYSAIAGAVMALTNTVWLSMAYYYKNKKERYYGVKY